MPLSEPPYERERFHNRTVECFGYRRADGLWDIEGHMVDTKTYAFHNKARGRIAPGDAIHNMWIRLTLDDSFEIKAIEAVTDDAPFPICSGITPNFQCIVGLKVAGGWMRDVKQRLGGVHGCTHLVELLGPMATVAFQTIYPGRERLAREAGRPSEASKTRPRIINSCHALSSDGPVVKDHWPQWYTGGE